jgi:hypothetical protein
LFDLSISTLSVEAGLENKDLPGVLATGAPRRAERLRAQDRLVLFFSQTGSEPLAANLQHELLSRLAETYFTAGGSVTAGLRVMTERLNDFLLNRNLRNTRQGGQLLGLFQAAVLHGNVLYLAQAGTVSSFLSQKTHVEQFTDPAGRSLGQAKLVSLRFYQASVESGDVLILAPETPDGWSVEMLAGSSQLTPDALRQRLVGQALDLRTVVVRFQTGKGEIKGSEFRRVEAVGSPVQPAGIYLSGKPLEAVSAVPVEGAAAQPILSPSEPVFHQKSEPRPVIPAAAGVEKAATKPPVSAPRREQVKPVRTVSESPARSAKSRLSVFTPLAARATRVIAFFRKANTNGAAAGQNLLKRVARAAPAGVTQQASPAGTSATSAPIGVQKLNLSPTTLLVIALAVPLIVATVGLTVYIRLGRGEEFKAYLNTAQQLIDQGAAQQDLTLQRQDYEKALFWMDKADTKGHSDEGDALRQRAQAALDDLDGIQRLAFLPALANDLPKDINIVRVAATISDLYLLDGKQGRVLRLFRSGQGYEYDSQFVCGPGRAGSAVIGPLVDIAALPPGNQTHATVMGIDEGGNVVYCTPNIDGFDSHALTPPDSRWSKILRIVMEQNQLYVLDPQVNAVYRYDSVTAPLSFDASPKLYFDKQVPRMADVIDLAVNQDYLYLLHSDGTMSTCTSSGLSVECADPTPFGDGRKGHSADVDKFAGTQFTLLESTDPPNPSIYVLDQENASIYQFSLRKLNLQGLYRSGIKPDYPLPARQPTAFAISPNRRAVMAYGYQVFYAVLP